MMRTDPRSLNLLSLLCLFLLIDDRVVRAGYCEEAFWRCRKVMIEEGKRFGESKARGGSESE